MGISHSTARLAAPASFVFDVAMQIYGMTSSPNMKDIHEKYPGAFSPWAPMIGFFFLPQQILQAVWLYRLWHSPPPDKIQAAEKREDVKQMDRYASIYTLGNLCIGTWLYFWNRENLVASQVLVMINSLAHLGFVVAGLDRMDKGRVDSVLTHVVAKMTAGIGLLDAVHNGSAAFFISQAPSAPVRIATAIAVMLGAGVSDGILGACLSYDLLALFLGQEGSWKTQLGIMTAASVAVWGVKNYLITPYSGKADYKQLRQGEDLGNEGSSGRPSKR